MKGVQTLLQDVSAAFEKAPSAIAVIKNDIVAFANKPFIELCGGDVVGKNIESLFEPKATDQIRWLMESPVVESDKIVLSLADGGEIMVEFWPFSKDLLFLVLRREYSLNRLADIDELTGLANRRKARMLLSIETARIDRQQNFCLAIGDIDFFKKINDTHGHDVGDEVLRHVSRVIQSGLRRGDWAARWGGEEFLIYINDSDLVTGLQPAERIRQMLEDSPFPGTPEINVTMSLGLVSSEGSGGDVGKIINAADVLLYEAKSNGRNRIEISSGDEKVWIIDNIREVIQKKKIKPQRMPIHGWNSEVVAVFLKPGLPKGEGDIDSLMKASERLSVRHEVECAMLDTLAGELPADSDTPHVLPVSNAMIEKKIEEVVRFFKRFPYVKIGISAKEIPPSQQIEQLLQKRIEIAILDFSPIHAAPLHIISRRVVTHIFYNTPGEAAKHVIDVIPEKMQFYAVVGETDESAEQREFLKSSGFNGMMRGNGG